MKHLKKIILSLTLFMLSMNAYSSHIAGGNIAYSCTGNPNEFLITLTLFRDCSGVNAPSNVSITFNNDCGLANPSLSMPLLSSSEVSQLCPSDLPNSTCGSNGADLYDGMEEYIYEGLVTLPGVCDSWTFGYSICDRNPTTNLSTTSCFYVETTLNSATQQCNNSVTVNSQPIPYVCNNLPVSYDYGILDQDGDSLVFTFVNALSSATNNIGYNTGFSATSPIPGITIDPNTGQLNFTPIITGNFVVTILIEEYNQAGQLVGTLMHDIQFVVEDCPNIPPVAPLSLTNFQNFGTNATLQNGNQISLCIGDQFCFDVVFTDADLMDVLDLTSNIANFLPGATITQSGTNPATATVCWTYQAGYTGSIISVNASDQVCPIPGFASFVIDLDIPPSLFPGEDGTVSICASGTEITLFDYLGGTFQNDGTWFDPNMQEINPILLPDTIISGVYTYTVYADPNSNSCIASASAEITVSVGQVNADFTYNHISCYGNVDGSAQAANITGDQGPFTVIWTGPNGVISNNALPAGSTSDITGLDLGVYTVVITDQIGCFYTEAANLTEPGAIQIEFINLDNPADELNHPQCIGTPTGSVTAYAYPATTGNNYSFLIYNEDSVQVNITGSNTANSLLAGWYYTSLIDDNGCEKNDSIELIDPLAMEVNFTIEHPLCHDFETGIVSVDNIENYQGGYPYIEYKWDPNPQGSAGNGIAKTNVGNLGAGEYSLIVTDSIGCSAQFIFYVTEPEPLYGRLDVASPTYCRTNSFQKGRGEVTVTNVPDSSGTGNVIYQWENLTNGDVGPNTTFIVDEPGWMKATLLDDNDCIFIDSIYVDSLNPIAAFTPISEQFYIPGIYEGTEDVEIEFINESINFSKPTYPLSDTTFKWNFYTNQDPGGEGNWFFSFDYNERIDTTLKGEQVYEVCLVAKNWNGCADTTCTEIIVHVKPDLIAPNVFTPGNSAGNPNFFFPSIGIETFSCTIFDRYGIKVFEFTDIETQWDGTHYKTGKNCVDGVYFYKYAGVSTDNTEFIGEGSVTLISDK